MTLSPGDLVLLIDGTAMAYRSFFAVRDLSTSDGTPTNALFGFIRALQHLMQKWNPALTVVAFDGGSPAERLEKCPEYKAQRTPMPDALRSQLPLLNDYLTASGIPWVLLARQEADDVLATLAVRGAAAGCQVILATSDKDLMQLVDSSIRMVPPAKSTDILDEEGVKTKTGVTPGQIVDWLSLIGDNADNIAGVPGVGPKTATKLLVAHGSLDALLQHIADVEPAALQEKLAAHRDLLARNQAIVKLNTDLPDVPAWDTLLSCSPDEEALSAFLQKYELHSGMQKGQNDKSSGLSHPEQSAPQGGAQLELF